MQTNFLDISYLQEGNIKQRRVYELLMNYSILSILSEYRPILVGTIPINIDIEGSDLDIVCEFKNAAHFVEYLISNFKDYPEFIIKKKSDKLVVCNFYIEEMMVEVYASDSSSSSSNGYRHMIIEHRILNLLGESFKKEIIRLKQEGLKTEPAFGKLLVLEGNSYEKLLELEDYKDEEILALKVNLSDIK